MVLKALKSSPSLEAGWAADFSLILTDRRPLGLGDTSSAPTPSCSPVAPYRHPSQRVSTRAHASFIIIALRSFRAVLQNLNAHVANAGSSAHTDGMQLVATCEQATQA